MEVKYIESLILIDYCRWHSSDEKIKKLISNEDLPKTRYEKAFLKAEKDKKSIEDSKILNRKKIEMLQKLEFNELKNRLKKMGVNYGSLITKNFLIA